MKHSRYNYFLQHEDKMICLNGISNKMILLKNDEYERLFNCDINILIENFPTIIKVFKKWNFFIEDSEDEINLIKYKNTEVLFVKKALWLTINPTLNCNMKCWYCSTDAYNAEYDKACYIDSELKNGIIKFIRNQITNYKASSVHLDWFGGEPLLYFNEVVYEISKKALLYSKKYKVPFSNHITTNGYLINKEMIERFKEIQLRSFQISVDGDRSKHNKVKKVNGKSSFDIVIKNLKLLISEFEDISIVLRINYDDNTLKNIQNLYDEFSTDEASKIRINFQRVWQTVKTINNESQYLNNAIDSAIKKGFIVSHYGFSPRNFHVCYADRNDYFAINYNGNVYKCTARGYKEEERIGRLTKSGIMLLDEYKIANYYSKATFDNDHCLKCKVLPLCYGPCVQKTKEYYSKTIDFTQICMLSLTDISLDTFLIEEAKNRGLI